jgi:hypothetical protein
MTASGCDEANGRSDRVNVLGPARTANWSPVHSRPRSNTVSPELSISGMKSIKSAITFTVELDGFVFASRAGGHALDSWRDEFIFGDPLDRKASHSIPRLQRPPTSTVSPR